jgi:hypothetical protein
MTPAVSRKPQVRGVVDLGCHYANTPALAAPSIGLSRPYAVLRAGSGDR